MNNLYSVKREFLEELTRIKPILDAYAPNKPNLFIVGAAKAGTTALQKNLSLHPEIYFSPIKEPHFFSDDIDISCFRDEFAKDIFFDLDEYFSQTKLAHRHQAYIRNENQYLKLYNEAKNQKLLAEASASYLWSVKAAQNIYEFNSNAKIIILLRDPVGRGFFSLYDGCQNGVYQKKHSQKH